MRARFLFWNYNVGKVALTAKEPIKGDPLARISNAREVDVLIIADCSLSTEEILGSLSKLGLTFSLPGPPDHKVRVFLRSGPVALIPVLWDERLCFFRLMSPGFEDLLIGATHLYDRRNYPEEKDRHSMVSWHYRTLVEAERQVGHDRTLLVGDFNMTPNEMGMVDPRNALGALMTWDLAEIQSSLEQGGSPRFFNPMWSLMGRSTAPGTHCWGSPGPYNIYWYCLDGVIVRPSLRGVFFDETLAILATIADPDGGEVPLVRLAEKHWKIEFSDHLPIAFDVNLREENPGASHG